MTTWNLDPNQIPLNTVVLCQVRDRPNVHTYYRGTTKKDNGVPQLRFITENSVGQFTLEYHATPLEKVLRWIDPTTIPDPT